MAQADPSAPSTNPQPRCSTRQPKPVPRDPNFIYTDLQCHLASLEDENDFPASSLFPESHNVSAEKGTKTKTKRPISKQRPQLLNFPYTDLGSQLYDLHLSKQDEEASPSSDLKQSNTFLPTSNVPKSHLSSPASPERDLNQEIHLVQLQKEKLVLELEVLRLRHGPSVSLDCQADETPNSSASVEKTRKKRAIDWPHEFAPGNSNSFDYDKLELPQFVAGF